MNTTLFLFTIGPVKSFIDHSRKARDLYAGSYLLSYLMKEVMEKLELDHKAKIIFPNQSNNPNREDQINFPNRLIAEVYKYSKEDKEKLGRELSDFVRQRFERISSQVFKKSKVKPNQAAEHQLQNFLEVYWAFEEESNYSLAYNKVNQSMSSIKRLRNFTQTNEPSGRKCDIYPEFNAIFVKRKKNGKLPAFVNEEHLIDITEVDKCKYAVKQGEGLSAIAYVKRMLHLLDEDQLPGYSLDIPSVAYMLLKHRLGEKYGEKLKLLKDEASEALFDLQNGQELSPDEYPPNSITMAKDIYQQIQTQEISPYYAILKFDGDGMGDLYRKCTNKEDHQLLSCATSRFANQVRGIISNQGGICIYAGGEDFLGFLPVDKLFMTLYELRQKFVAQVKAPRGHSAPLTFSAGIVIAHLMQPLKIVLAKTGEMERQAKELYEEKNSFAIGLLKRSGDQLLIKSSFGENGEILCHIHNVIAALSQKEYSKSFIYNLSRTLDKLEGGALPDQEPLVRVLIEESLLKSASSITKEERETQSEALYLLFLHFGSNLNTFISFLQFAAFVSREVQSCSMPLMR